MKKKVFISHNDRNLEHIYEDSRDQYIPPSMVPWINGDSPIKWDDIKLDQEYTDPEEKRKAQIARIEKVKKDIGEFAPSPGMDHADFDKWNQESREKAEKFHAALHIGDEGWIDWGVRKTKERTNSVLNYLEHMRPVAETAGYTAVGNILTNRVAPLLRKIPRIGPLLSNVSSIAGSIGNPLGGKNVKQALGRVVPLVGSFNIAKTVKEKHESPILNTWGIRHGIDWGNDLTKDLFGLQILRAGVNAVDFRKSIPGSMKDLQRDFSEDLKKNLKEPVVKAMQRLKLGKSFIPALNFRGKNHFTERVKNSQFKVAQEQRTDFNKNSEEIKEKMYDIVSKAPKDIRSKFEKTFQHNPENFNSEPFTKNLKEFLQNKKIYTELEKNLKTSQKKDLKAVKTYIDNFSDFFQTANDYNPNGSKTKYKEYFKGKRTKYLNKPMNALLKYARTKIDNDEIRLDNLDEYHDAWTDIFKNK